MLLLLPENDVRVDKVAQRSVHGLHARLSCFDSRLGYHHFFSKQASTITTTATVEEAMKARAMQCLAWLYTLVCVYEKTFPQVPAAVL